MKIYNYLFYKGHQLATRSGNFDDMPVLGAITFVVPCVILNIFTVALMLEGIQVMDFTFDKTYKYTFTLLVVLTVLFYYMQGNRHEKVIKKYEAYERKTQIGLHPLLVFLLYYSITFAILLLAGFFKNGDWIFSN